MNQLFKRSLSALMALLLIISLFAGISIPADAATVNYQYGSYGDYSKVILNWGTRGETATFLSPKAEEFYKNTSYETLAAKSGSSNLTIVDTSALYIALSQLMSGAHKTVNSYGESRNLMPFTDIEKNGSVTTQISSFYSGVLVGPAWDAGATWSREHTWPNSKGGTPGTDNSTKNHETDIMMLRPVPQSENSSRSNNAYGMSSGYYYPNKESGGKYDVRGDVARIVLYSYVRWGTTEIKETNKDTNVTVTKKLLDNMWGSSGVIESKEVLLDWMEADPVDTWEMGRNDSVQSITGTRNVFVDYPELAFELFEEDVPVMVTPSGKAAGGAECKHSQTTTNIVNATCTQDGLKTVTCTTCGKTVSTTVIKAQGHTEASYEVPPSLTQGGYTQLYCSVCNVLMEKEDQSSALAGVESWNVTLGSDLRVNFNVYVDAAIRNTAKIHIKVANTQKEYNVSDLTAQQDNTFLISVKIAAAQMTDVISVQIVNGTEKTEPKTYSIRSYAETVLAGNHTEKTKTLVKQMLHYGAAAQSYFGYHTERLANAGLETTADATPAASAAPSYSGTASGITYAGATLLFRDRIAVRFYFETAGDIDAYTFTVDGKTCTPVKKGERYYIEVADINPQDLNNRYTVKVNNSLTVSYSPMNYLANMAQKGSEEVQPLVKALYAYYLAAVEYLK